MMQRLLQLAAIAAAFFLVAWGAGVMSRCAAAADLPGEQAAVIYAIAYGHVGGQLPAQPPTIHIVDRAALQQLACNGGNCPARGFQRGQDVYVDAALDFTRPADAAVLLHELVHYFQFARWGPAQDCLEWIARERTAYRIQIYELARMGADAGSVLATARSVGCG